MKGNYKLNFLFLLFFFSSVLFGQIQNFESRTNEIDHFVKEEKELSKKIEKKLTKLQKKSGEISKIKSKKSANILTNRKLQNLLRDSKEIADELDILEERKNRLKNSIYNKSSELVEQLDRELVISFRKTKSLNRNSKDYKNGLKKLTGLYQLRSKYSRFVQQSDYSIRLIPIEFSSDETNKSLKTKLDLLRDQEDYLSSINMIIKDKLNKSQDWSNLTHLAGDLMEDIQVQQNQDETIVKSNASVAAMTLETGPEKGRDLLANSKIFSANEIVIPVEFDNIYQLDRNQLEQQIKQLKKFEKLIKTKIDSLSTIIKQNR